MPRTSVRMASANVRTSAALASDVSASARTSSATTAKPRPCSPARAASMAAFRARRLVWSETCSTVPVISPMLVAPRSSSSIRVTEADCRWELACTAATEAVICTPVSAKSVWNVAVDRREVSARSRASDSREAMPAMAPMDSCAAPAASSAPEAICSIERRSSSAADEASVTPAASSSVAAASRSAALSRLARDRSRDRPTGLGVAGEGLGAFAPASMACPCGASRVLFTSDIDGLPAFDRPSCRTQGRGRFGIESAVLRPRTLRSRITRIHAKPKRRKFEMRLTRRISFRT